MNDFICIAILPDGTRHNGRIVTPNGQAQFITDAGVINWHEIQELDINLGYYGGKHSKGKTSPARAAAARAAGLFPPRPGSNPRGRPKKQRD